MIGTLASRQQISWVVKVSTWLYVLDVFKPIDIDIGKLLTLTEEDPIKLFNEVKEALESDLEGVEDVKVRDIYFNPKASELLIEYIVRCDLGEVSVKLIHSKNPRETLIHYYKHEKSSK